MNLYFISGLGADKRVFQKLTISETFTIHHLEWVQVIPEETLAQYCNRLTGQINLDEPFVLIGLSFGGVVAIELSRKIKPVKIILISSIARTEEAGMLNRVLGRLKLYRIIPVRFLLTPSRFLFRLFGAHTREEKDLLTGILQDTDPDFFRWSLDRLFSWKNEWEPEHLLHIHGTGDKIIPYSERMQAIPVKGGEHLMVYSKAEEISGLLRKYLPAG
jgi:pimeloyl-ACP methyl ester carboxylesterase